MIFYFSLAILISLLGASLLWGRSFGDDNELNIADTKEIPEKNSNFLKNGEDVISLTTYFKYAFFFSIVFIFAFSMYQSFRQYIIWSSASPSRFLLPPYESINYFIEYALTRFFAHYLISLVAAILFFISAGLLNRRYNERFFYPEEIWMGALAMFLAGHPGWLFYFVLVVLVYLLIHIFSLFATRYSLERISLYYLWLPIAIFVILISNWLDKWRLWQILKF